MSADTAFLCVICGLEHNIYKCPKLAGFTAQDRYKILRKIVCV